MSLLGGDFVSYSKSVSHTARQLTKLLKFDFLLVSRSRVVFESEASGGK